MAALLVVAMQLGPSPVVALADGITPVPGVDPAITQVTINNGAGSQTDPHVSGTLVSYTDNSVFGIRYYDFATGQGGLIPQAEGFFDSLSDVSGSKIAFLRISSTSQGVYVFDVNAPDAGVQEIDPKVGVLRRRPAIGNGTIAWEDLSYDASSSAQLEITVYDPIAGDTIRLTNDTEADIFPAVSADGDTVAWVKTPIVMSDYEGEIYYATRSGGWAAVQLTGSEGGASFPDTNGKIVVYGSDASGDDDIHWKPVGGSTDTWLAMPGVQRNPNISGNLIAFESSATLGAQFDIYVYDLSTGLLYQLTNTSVSETLSDISVGADGNVRVVWAQPKQVYPYDMDVYGLTFELSASASLTMQPLFDQAHAHRVGSVVPIRLRLLDAQSNNVSSPSLTLTVTGLVQKDGSAVADVIDDAGNSNPDYAFRYDPALGGYAYNLSTKGMATGTWELQFTVSGDSSTYGVTFDLR